MTREEMKMMFLQMDCSNVPVRKEIIVDLRYLDNKHWPNYGYVQILSDGPDGYSSFSSFISILLLLIHVYLNH